MTKTDNLKGAAYSIFSALSVSLVYILSKIAQNHLSTDIFLFWWFGFGSLWGTFVILKMNTIKKYYKILKENILFLGYFAVAEAFATFLFFYLIKQLNPSVVSFLGSIGPMIVVILGYFILKEKLNLTEGIGGLIALSGLIIITYTTPDISFKNLLILFTMIFIYSLNTILVRKHSKKIPSFMITALRLYFLFLSYTVLVLIKGSFVLPDKQEFLVLLIGSLAGPVLGMYFLFKALSYTKAVTVSIIKSIQPFIVAMEAYLFLNLPITFKQLIGGTILVIGINIILFASKVDIRSFISRPVKN